MASKRKEEKRKEERLEIPDVVYDPTQKKKYKKGRFLGRGGFARCYELIDYANNKIFAGKVIAKAQLQKADQKEKMTQEICIHRSVKHKHIVGFHTYFEDKDFIYIILELCSKRSLMEMHKRRKTFSEPEVRYIVKQIALACDYLHHNKIVHRDLKLGNLFLNEEMDVKVGDFGLATKICNESDRKLTLCGTPNYIAPEVLMKTGHSFEVDVWSLGCIVYTLVVGKPPFETDDLKNTYKKIQTNEYTIPDFVPAETKAFIDKMLRLNPKERPLMSDILKDSYLTQNYIPSRLPQSCLTMAPRYNNGRLSIMPTEYASICTSPRKPLGNKNQEAVAIKAKHEPAQNANVKPGNEPNEPVLTTPNPLNPNNWPKDFHLKELSLQLHKVVATFQETKESDLFDEAEHPASIPVIWISKWVDYTDRYGIGYQLCDNSVGILFNDITRVVLLADGQNLQYIERDGVEHFHTLDNYPDSLKKKMTLLKYFRNYMNEHLLKCGEKVILKEEDDLTRLPYLNNWFRTRNAIVFQLTNGTVQLNFFQDHTKLILCPHMGAVTYINEKRDFRTFKFSLIEKFGCTQELKIRLRYARDVVDRLMTHKLSSNTKHK